MKDYLRQWLRVYLWLQFISGFFSSFMWVNIEITRTDGIKDVWTWFSRMAVAMIAAGFLAIIYSIENKKEQK